MTTPTPDALAASCRAFALQCNPLGVSGVLNEAAALIQQQLATIERLNALVEESLYHLRLDEAAKAYHERALAALGPR